MKVVIVYGNQRKGSTYNCVKIIKEKLKNLDDITFDEFWLPKAIPNFCRGCFSCFLNGEDTCPHYDNVKPIVEKIINSDAVILASPVYGLDVTGAMKTFIDHLCYMWISHRPNKKMFSKIGFTVSTTAGMGTKSSNKTMRRALDYMGIKRTFCFGTAVAATSWEEVKEIKKNKIEKKLNKKATKFYKAINNRKKLSDRLFTRFLFKIIKNMVSSFNDGHYDKEYWKSMGWLNKSDPFI
ncbi:MAG: flavodoxin family protein [Firmicutes bacterium]|nr:flavodoxin family protein [Bacillota bacterium]